MPSELIVGVLVVLAEEKPVKLLVLQMSIISSNNDCGQLFTLDQFSPGVCIHKVLSFTSCHHEGEYWCEAAFLL